jgi:hypothetical protein
MHEAGDAVTDEALGQVTAVAVAAGPQRGDMAAAARCGRRSLSWTTRERKTKLLFGVLFGVSALFALFVYGGIIDLIVERGALYVNHIFLFWGWSKFVHVIVPANLIYVRHELYAFEHSVAGSPRSHLPFAYPPSLLLMIWPLALVSPVIAWMVWTVVGLVCYLAACWQRGWGATNLALALVAPATVGAIFAAQTALIAAALMIGGCRMMDRQPVVAGILFGLLAAVKPQYGVLIPLALISSREWRSFVAATGTVMTAVAASSLAFGWKAWSRLPDALVGLSQLVARHPKFAWYSPTVTSGLRMLGASPMATSIGQIAVAACAIVLVWRHFRRGFTPMGGAALMVGAFLVTPYALYYDLPLVSYAVLVMVMDWHARCRALGTAEVAILALAVALPVLIYAVHVSWGLLVLPLLFALILRRAGFADRALVRA